MSKATAIITFTIGAAIGATTAWYITKKRYEQIAQEEIDSVKDTFSKLYKREEDDVTSEETSDDSDEEEDEGLSVMEYAVKLRQEGYTNTDVGRQNKPVADAPYVIPPESFDELEGYSVRSLTYYSDNVLADDDDRIVEDVEALVGSDSLNHFGEYEDDSVFVRNDRLKCDFEILYDNRKYADVLKKEPYKAEV